VKERGFLGGAIGPSENQSLRGGERVLEVRRLVRGVLNRMIEPIAIERLFGVPVRPAACDHKS